MPVLKTAQCTSGLAQALQGACLEHATRHILDMVISLAYCQIYQLIHSQHVLLLCFFGAPCFWYSSILSTVCHNAHGSLALLQLLCLCATAAAWFDGSPWSWTRWGMQKVYQVAYEKVPHPTISATSLHFAGSFRHHSRFMLHTTFLCHNRGCGPCPQPNG